MKSETRMQHCIDMRLQVRMQKILAAAMLAGETGMAESMVGIIMPGSSRLDQVADICQKSFNLSHSLQMRLVKDITCILIFLL